MPGVQPNGGGSGRRGRRVSSTLAEINVVPLVDIMLVLLIIFMITAPMIQRGVEVNLPVSRQASTIEGERVFVTVPATYRTTGKVFFGEDEIRIEALAERARQKLENVSDKQVYLRGDGAVLYRDLMDVFSRLKEAGVQKVGLVTDPPRDRR
jgi:biopolymer transport protein TolR